LRAKLARATAVDSLAGCSAAAGNSCIIKDIDAALKELGAEPPSHKKK